MLASLLQACGGPPRPAPSDEEIRAILARRVDVERQAVGVVVGMVDAGGRRIVAYGHPALGSSQLVDGDTIFEIGSITKVFTGLLLADMAGRRQVRLSEPVQGLLPPGVRVPTYEGRPITLADLATHTSGLPRLPENMAPKDPGNPYADYTRQQLFDFLGGYELKRAPGRRFEYSNLGMGLLGQALAYRAGEADYAALVQHRIVGPLGLHSTAISLPSALQPHMAVAHDRTLEPVQNWDLPTIAGAGALRSSADDILTLLEAELGLRATPLAAAMELQRSARRPIALRQEIALGWMVRKRLGGEIFWHNGGTGGSTSFMGFDPKTGRGVVVLANAAPDIGVDDIGLHLLTGAKLAQPKAPVVRKAIELDGPALSRLAGRYRFAPGMDLEIRVEDGGLIAQMSGQPALPVYPQSPTQVFWRAVDAEVSFVMGPDGRAQSLELRQAGRKLRAIRVPEPTRS